MCLIFQEEKRAAPRIGRPKPDPPDMTTPLLSYPCGSDGRHAVHSRKCRPTWQQATSLVRRRISLTMDKHLFQCSLGTCLVNRV